MAWLPSSRSFCRVLLFAYPAEFRQEYGVEMDRFIADRMAAEPRFRVWLALFADVLRNAPKEHIHILVRDLRHSFRLFAKAPGFTATALLALALGIGAAVTIFSLIDTVLIRSLPFGDARQLVYLWTPLPRYQSLPKELGPAFADVLAWRAQSHSFESITAFQQRMITLNSEADPVRINAAMVLDNFFETLQASPALGRTIQPNEDRVAVLSDAFWSSQFNRDPQALGKTIQIAARTYRVIGVMPPQFAYPHENDYPARRGNLKKTDMWIPAALTPQQQANRMITSDAAVGRLRPGVSLSQAQAEMSMIEKGLDQLNLPEMRGTQSLIVSFIESAVGPVRSLMRLLAGAVLLVLLIACGNVANLLMARAATRQHEMGVRTALGAPRSRIIRQVLTESVFLSVTGGAIGAFLCFTAIRILAKMNPGDIPRFDELSVDWRVLSFALLISIVTGIVFGALPAFTASRAGIVQLLREGGGRGIAGSSSRARYGLVIADVALAVVLLGGAVLLIRSYLVVQGQDKGFAPSTLTMRLAANLQTRIPPEKMATFARTVVDRVASIPGVVAIGGINALPLSHSESTSTFRIEGYQNRPNQSISLRWVAGDYFSAMQIPLIAGRYVTTADIPSQPATPVPPSVVISESFAKAYGTGIGAHIQRGQPGPVWSTVVGIVADVRHSNLEAPPTPTLYEPSWAIEALAVRTTLPPDSMIPTIRGALRSANTPFLLTEVETMRERTSAAAARRRFQTVLLATFAAIAVFLALIGLYGLLSYAVRQRTAEIGVRMALGAGRSQVIGMIVRQGLGVSLAGLLIGLVAMRLVAGLGASLLYGVTVYDPITFLLVPALMLLASTFACIFPAWRASLVDPVKSLRYQ